MGRNSRLPPDAASLVAAGNSEWSSEAWRELVLGWIDDMLAVAGARRTGPITQPHLQAWSTVLQVPTESGSVWFKAASRATKYEVDLYGVLSKAVPRQVLTPIAAEPSQGWLLLPDGGPSLGDQRGGLNLTLALEQILPQYAQAQLDLVPYAKELTDLGLRDMRPTLIPSLFGEVIEALERQLRIWGSPMDMAALDQIRSCAPRLQELSQELSEDPCPATLDHGDLHPWHILVEGDGTHLTARFYDWGDSVVGHPFASMRPYDGILAHLGLDSGGGSTGDLREAVRARDAYLEPFQGIAPRADLVQSLDHACVLARVVYAISWLHAIGQGEEMHPMRRRPLEVLCELLDRDIGL